MSTKKKLPQPAAPPPRSARAAPRVPATRLTSPSSPTHPTAPIVGIGASAGCLEALEPFLKGVPPRSGLALVIVQHLDPTHQDILPELLQRATPMKVLLHPSQPEPASSDRTLCR